MKERYFQRYCARPPLADNICATQQIPFIYANSKSTNAKKIFRKIQNRKIFSNDIVRGHPLADNIFATHQRTSNTSIINLNASPNKIMKNHKKNSFFKSIQPKHVKAKSNICD